MKRKLNFCYLSFVICVILTLTACGTDPYRIDPKGNGDLVTAHDINFKDWQNVAEKAADSLIKSGALRRSDGKKNILMISDVKNNTAQHINTEILTDKLRADILKSGQALTTTAISANGPEDAATRNVRNLEFDELYNKDTVEKNGTAVAPNMSLSGSIVQEKTKYNRSEESYFLFHVVLTDLKTGLATWEDNFEVVKQKKRALIGLQSSYAKALADKSVICNSFNDLYALSNEQQIYNWKTENPEW